VVRASGEALDALVSVGEVVGDDAPDGSPLQPASTSSATAAAVARASREVTGRG
jgi:hypothetical protein